MKRAAPDKKIFDVLITFGVEDDPDNGHVQMAEAILRWERRCKRLAVKLDRARAEVNALRAGKPS